jgi:hypothetical protein
MVNSQAQRVQRDADVANLGLGIEARKKRRSNNRAKARETLHRAHQRDANARKNYLHHVSKSLVGRYDKIALGSSERLRLGARQLGQIDHGCRGGNPAVPGTLQG